LDSVFTLPALPIIWSIPYKLGLQLLTYCQYATTLIWAAISFAFWFTIPLLHHEHNYLPHFAPNLRRNTTMVVLYKDYDGMQKSLRNVKGSPASNANVAQFLIMNSCVVDFVHVVTLSTKYVIRHYRDDLFILDCFVLQQIIIIQKQVSINQTMVEDFSQFQIILKSAI
jgi:hypothetical protein